MAEKAKTTEPSLLKSLAAGEQIDFRGEFSPARTPATNGAENQNIFDLNHYYWYPEGFLEFYKNKDIYSPKFYDKIVGQFAVDSTGFVGMAINDTIREISDIGTGIKNIKKRIGEFFDPNEEEVKPETEDTHLELLEEIPYVKILEFQPRSELGELINTLGRTYDAMNNIMSNIATSPTKMETLKETFSADTFEEIINLALKTNISNMTPHEKWFDAIPSFFYEGLIGGTYTAQYKVPLFEQTNFLHAMGDQGWEPRTMRQKFLGNMISGLVNKIPGLGSFDIATRPKFSLEATSPTADALTIQFHLFNYDIKALVANLKFAHAITAGAYWVQAHVIQLPSNLYDIEVPGRFRYYFCKGTVQIDFAGKVRTLHGAQLAEIKKSLKPAVAKYSLNEEAFRKCPDAFKVTLTFTSLLPNNLNTYMYYLMGKKAGIVSGKQQEGTAAGIAKAMADHFGKEQDGDTPATSETP